MNFSIHKADKRHLTDINKLIVEAKIGETMSGFGGHFWIAKSEEKIIGCVGTETINENAAIIIHLVVEKLYRKRGVGMALLNHAERFVQNRGLKTIALATMYYYYRSFKKRGYRTCPRANLPEPVKDYWMFTALRYKKCGVMIKHL